MYIKTGAQVFGQSPDLLPFQSATTPEVTSDPSRFLRVGSVGQTFAQARLHTVINEFRSYSQSGSSQRAPIPPKYQGNSGPSVKKFTTSAWPHLHKGYFYPLRL